MVVDVGFNKKETQVRRREPRTSKMGFGSRRRLYPLSEWSFSYNEKVISCYSLV